MSSNGRGDDGGGKREDGTSMRFNFLNRFDADWFYIGSELSVNLAAGWLGVAFIVPNFSAIHSPFNFLVLTGDILMAILFIVIAFKLRKLSKGGKKL